MNVTGVNFKIIKDLLNKYGVDVEVTPVTKTISNTEGDEKLTSGTKYTERVYFSRKTKDWSLDEAGLIKGGDGVMLINDDSLINKDYKIKHSGNHYRVQDVIERSQAGGHVMFKTCNVFLIDGD